jgi:NADP-dependent 3-hydroxy acid dehydrogenase YdfG
VTGASAGIGRAIAEMLLEEGVRVWGTARELSRLHPLMPRAGFTPVVFDLTNGGSALEVFTHAADAAGGSFDLVINNAGYGVFSPFAAVEFSTWQGQLDSMITTTLRISHAAFTRMLAKNRGCLVNISSLAVEFPMPFMTGYNVAKAALSAASESLIFETLGTSVTVIDFRPGDYRTSFNQSMHSTSAAVVPHADARLLRVWQALEANLNAAPPPAQAARDLRRALLRGRSGTVRSGSLFQARIAPFLSRLASGRLRRLVMARYFGAV